MEKMSLPLAYAMKKKMAHMCKGGDCAHPSHMMAQGGDPLGSPESGHEKGIHLGEPNKHTSGTEHSHAQSWAGVAVRSGSPKTAKAEHERVLSEMKSMPKPKLMAEGGDADDCHPMVKRIMMSRGGMVANEDAPEADSMPAEFDDLVLDDHLEGENSGAADGDELGDEQEDHDREDIVSRIMKSRAKKDRNPRPA